MQASKADGGGRVLGTLVLVLGFVLLFGCQQVLPPTPNLYLQGDTDWFADVPSELQTSTVHVLYVTDRAQTQKEGRPTRYGYKRSGSVAWGSSAVELGNGLTWDELAALSQVRKRSRSVPVRLRSTTELGRFPSIPMPMAMQGGRLVVDSEALTAQEMAAEALRDEVRTRLAVTPLKEVFILIHGVGNSFADAVTKTAAWQHYSRGQGVWIAYTWPAGHSGLLEGYVYDFASSRFTVYHLKQLYRALAACPEVERINIVAHSRGTDTAATAVREVCLEARAQGTTRSTLKLGHLVLLASDMDLEVVGQRDGGDHVFDMIDRVTVYASTKDQALGFSNWLWDSARRAGQIRYKDLDPNQQQLLLTATTMNAIDVRVNTGGLGHSYFSNPAVASDLLLLLLEDRPPGKEHGRPLEALQPGFWGLDKGYPATDAR